VALPHFAATMPLMPSWLVAPAVVVLLAAGALHWSHARAARGFARWWHAAHVAMVAGMVVMFLLPPPGSAGLFGALAAAFGAHAAAMAAVTRRVSGVDSRVWAASMLDQVLMAYMLLPPAARPAALTSAAIAYLVAAAVAWLLVPEKFTCITPPRGVAVRQRVTVAVREQPTVAAPQRFSSRLVGNLTTGVRLTLMAMALAMAWMLLAVH
jgi:hypothetical protein